MRHSLLLLLLLRQTLCSLAEYRHGGAPRGSPHRHLDQDCEVSCHVVRPEVLVEEGFDHHESTMIDCIEHDKKRRRTIPLIWDDNDDLFLLKEAISAQLEAGTLHLCITQAYWTGNDDTINLSLSTWTNQDHIEQRQLQGRTTSVARHGVKSLLAVRVVADGIGPRETVAEIERTIFGTLNDGGNSVVDQYLQLTHGRLQYVPLNHPNVRTNGVLEVEMPTLEGVNVQGIFTELLLNRTRNVLVGENSDILLEDAVDNVIFCLPDGGLFKGSREWTAFTYLFEPFSYYQKERCTRLSVAVHELGHSLGFQHSGVDDNIYADKTGYMGYAVNQVGSPLKAFNAHKHWMSGWFQDRAVMVNPYQDGTSYMRLIGFVDASDPRLQDNDVAVIRVAPYLYLHFNVARSYNRDTDFPNAVTIVEALSDDKVSIRKAELARPGDSYTYTVSETWDSGTVIEICSMVLEEGFVSHAMISVHLENAASACDTDVDIWAPNWDEKRNTPAPVSSPTNEGDFDFGGTPEDNDGQPVKRLTLQPAASPVDTLMPTSQSRPTTPQATPTTPLSPWIVPSRAPIDWPSLIPDPKDDPSTAGPTDEYGGAIDEEEDESGNGAVIGLSVSSVVGALVLLSVLVRCSIKNEVPLTRTVSKEPNASQGTVLDVSSVKSSNKDQDISETEIDDWWGDNWFNFDCHISEEKV